MSRTDFVLRYARGPELLDIGSVGGTIHDLLLERLPDAHIHGLDMEDQKLHGKSYPNQTVGNAEAMPYASNTFDCVYMGEVLEHTWVPQQLMGECNRVLKPGGLLILDTPNVYAFSRIARYLLLRRDIILGNPDHKIFYSRAMLENLFHASGFTVIDLRSDDKISLKSHTFSPTHFGLLSFMGEHLMGVGEKVADQASASI